MRSEEDDLIRARIAHYRAKVFVITEKLKKAKTADEMIELFNEKLMYEEKIDYNIRRQNGELYKEAAKQMRWDYYQYNGETKSTI